MEPDWAIKKNKRVCNELCVERLPAAVAAAKVAEPRGNEKRSAQWLSVEQERRGGKSGSSPLEAAAGGFQMAVVCAY